MRTVGTLALVTSLTACATPYATLYSGKYAFVAPESKALDSHIRKLRAVSADACTRVVVFVPVATSAFPENAVRNAIAGVPGAQALEDAEMSFHEDFYPPFYYSRCYEVKGMAVSVTGGNAR